MKFLDSWIERKEQKIQFFPKYNDTSHRSSLIDHLCRKQKEYQNFSLLNWNKRTWDTDFQINKGNENIIPLYGNTSYVSKIQLDISYVIP